MSSYEDLSWTEVSFGKALKMWANNQVHVKCEVDRHTYFYHGQYSMTTLDHKQIKDGKWYVESR